MKCITYFMLLPSFRFALEALLVLLGASLLGCCCFFWALGYYAWKLCSQKKNKMHLKHLINFFRRAHIRKAQQRNFTLLSPRKCPGQHMHILIIFYIKSYNVVMSNMFMLHY